MLVYARLVGESHTLLLKSQACNQLSCRLITAHMAANVDHAAISKMALPDLSAPEKATLASKTGLTEDKATYSDARGLDGSFKMPDVSTLQFVKGEAPTCA